MSTTEGGNRSVGPLSGLRVIDLSSVLMGPYCTQMLGDMGADVIKIESLDGDILRQVGPSRSSDMGPLFLNANRSKRSVAVDLKQASGRQALLRLLASADVLIYNIRPQAMERLGLSFEELSKSYPRLIYAGVFGYGQDGPYADLPAYDDLIQGASTLAALFSRSTGRPPQYVPSAVVDRVTGLSAVGLILAALHERSQSGLGQRLDIPMFETMVNFVLSDHLGGLTFNPSLDEGGYARQLSPNRRPYKTLDGYISALIYTDKQWRSFFRLLGKESDFDADPRFVNLAARSRHIDEIYVELEDTLSTQGTEYWLKALQTADIPVAPVHDLQSIFHDPHLLANSYFTKVQHPTEGALVSMRSASTWSRTQPKASRHAPLLGEHTKEVLREVGYYPAEIECLLAGRVVKATDTTKAG